MTAITAPEDIAHFRLITLRGGVRLESKGMRRHGKQCKAIVIQEFGLPPRSSYDDVLDFLNKKIGEGK